jgi:hypothetical protein
MRVQEARVRWRTHQNECSVAFLVYPDSIQKQLARCEARVSPGVMLHFAGLRAQGFGPEEDLTRDGDWGRNAVSASQREFQNSGKGLLNRGVLARNMRGVEVPRGGLGRALPGTGESITACG